VKFCRSGYFPNFFNWVLKISKLWLNSVRYSFIIRKLCRLAKSWGTSGSTYPPNLVSPTFWVGD
jgi:hypothetical protein